MKFLTAASLVCLALIGQTQGGSLRGYTYSVPVPHETYGVPLEVSQPIVEDVPTITVEQPAAPESSAPAVFPEVQNIPLVDSLPFTDTAANFVIPPEPQPELPYLQPGLPTLPERPVVPAVVVEEPLPEVQNTYLPPVRETSGTTVTEASYPGDVAPDAEVIETAAIPIAPAQPTLVDDVPQISEIPALPAAPVTPSTPAGPQPSETYGPPAVHVYEVPQFAVHATVASEPSAVYGTPTEAPAAPKISEIPALPAAPVTPSAPVQVYEVPAAPVTPYVPVTATPTPSSVYGPPIVAYEHPQIAEIPALPAAPVIPSVQVYEVPAAPETPQAAGTPSSVYGPPTVAFEHPPAPKIAEIPALPAAPVIPSVQIYEVPAAPETPQATGTPSSVYGPPTVAYEYPPAPKIAEIPALPAAPVIPSVPVYEVPAAPETPQAAGTPSSVYGAPTVAYEYPPAPKIAEIPALPAAPVIPSVPVYEVPAAPETPQAAGTPSSVYGAPTVAYEHPPAPRIAEIPALPAAPVIPSVQVYEVPSAPVVLVSSGQAPHATVPSTPLTGPTVTTHTFSIRPIVSQIINFASSFLPAGEESNADSAPVEVPEAVPGYSYEKPAQAFPAPGTVGLVSHVQTSASSGLGAASVPVKSPETVPVPVEVPVKAGYTYEKPVQAFPTPGFVDTTSELGSVSVKAPEGVTIPAEVPVKSGYNYKKPVKGFPTSVSVGLVNQVQNSASSLSSSSIHVNHVVLPSIVQPPGSADTVFVEQVQPSGSGFTIQSVSENTAQTSAGNFNQVSFVQHGVPHISPITGFVGVGAPHSVFAVPSF